jgi:hypothetical protein
MTNTAYTDPYSTHLPVLYALGELLPIEYVLELGAGLRSTPAFLDRARFPYLKMLTSYEPNVVWRQRVRDLIRVYNPRWTLISELEPNTLTGWGVASNGFEELIFIDNGDVEADRIPVIEVIARAKPSAVVVIHDFERVAYQEAAAGFEHRVVCNSLTPHTAVLWNEDRPELEHLTKAIWDHLPTKWHGV